jgi:hypothetical protein
MNSDHFQPSYRNCSARTGDNSLALSQGRQSQKLYLVGGANIIAILSAHLVSTKNKILTSLPATNILRELLSMLLMDTMSPLVSILILDKGSWGSCPEKFDSTVRTS